MILKTVWLVVLSILFIENIKSQSVNYNVRLVGLMAYGDDADGSGWAGRQDGRWKIWVTDNNSGGWSGGNCLNPNNDYGTWISYGPVTLKTRTGCSASVITIDIEGWEEDACGDDCTFDDDCWFNNDDNHDGRGTAANINFLDMNPCQWNLYEVNYGDYYARIEIYWDPATVQAGTITSNQTFCASGNPSVFNNSSLPLPNASTPNSLYYTYQWQSSSDGVNFYDISGATSTTYDVGVISQTTYYRRKEVSCNSITSYSNIITVTINPDTDTPVFTQFLSARCQGSGTDTYQATANNSVSITYSLSPPAAGTINFTTGEVIWDSGFYGNATITASSQGCGASPKTSNYITNVVRAPFAGNNATFTFCSTIASVDLNTMLGGTPDAGGIWYYPSGIPLTGSLFNPSVMSSGVYYYCVTGTAPCVSDTGFIDITVTPDTDIPVFSSPITERCQGTGTDIVTATANNSNSMSYQLTPVSAGTINTSTGEITWNPVFYGSSTVTATSTGCNQPVTHNHIIEVTQKPNAGGDNSFSLCFGEPDFDMDTLISGYHQPGGNWYNPTGNPLVNGMFHSQTYASGSYAFVVSGTGSCINDTSFIDVTVLELPGFSSIAISSNTVCQAPYSGIIATDPDYGLSPYQFSFNSGPLTSDSVFVNLTGGSYSLVIFDSNNCSFDTSLVVPTITGFQIDSVMVTDVLCNGFPTGSIVVIAPGAVQYSINGGTPQSDSLFSSLLAGNYTVLAQNSFSCTSTYNTTISEPEPLNVYVSIANSTCGATGSAIANVIGGVPPYTYNWSNGLTAYSIQNLPPDTLELIVTDNNSCTDTTTNIIIGNDGGTGNVTILGQDDVTCYGLSDGTATAAMTNGLPPFIYSWSNNPGLNVQTIAGLSEGTYSVTVTDVYGCSGSTIFMISEPDELTIGVTAINHVLCYGGTTGSVSVSSSGGTPFFIWNWSNGNNNQNLTQVPAGSYSVTITDVNGCTDIISSILVNEPANALYVTISSSDITCSSSPNGSALAIAGGGTLPYNYMWSNGQTGNQLNQVPEGEYSLLVSDANNCNVMNTIAINNIANSPVISEELTNASCPGAHDAGIALFLTGGNPPFEYSWSTGDNSSTIESVTSGEYTVIISDTYNCTSTYSYILTNESSELCVKIPTTFTPNGDGYNDTWQIQYAYLYPDMTVEVFNRWGDKIFNSVGYNEVWDGTINGNNKAPVGSYVYIINLGNNLGFYNGILTIIY